MRELLTGLHCTGGLGTGEGLCLQQSLGLSPGDQICNSDYRGWAVLGDARDAKLMMGWSSALSCRSVLTSGPHLHSWKSLSCGFSGASEAIFLG